MKKIAILIADDHEVVRAGLAAIFRYQRDFTVAGEAEDGPMRPSALRKAVGIRSSIHFNRYYLSPLLEKDVIARTDPDHPQSPQQRYCLT